jgi:anti-sigma regulatory factor (Ser/Thr protein kinase)/GNAT superfamily N-acetyltransferase
MLKKNSSITVPNDPAYIGSVLSFSKELASSLGFTEREALEIGIALSEACENVIMHAFDPYEDESFTVSFEVLDDGLKILVDEMGMPFSAGIGEEGKETPGLHAMRENMDEVRFINRGKEGKELELYKYLKGRHVEELFSDVELTPYQSCDIPAKTTKYTFRQMEPSEAADVSRCIYRAYKYTYLNEDLYFPERIEARNRDCRMISFVAVTDSSEVVAHFALLPRPNRKSAEVGVAVVVPEHRKKKLMKILLHKLVVEAKKRGFLALYGNAFTMHTLSQRTNLKFDFSESALQLGVFPPGTIGIMCDKGLKGAGNVLTFFKYLKYPTENEIFLPIRHEKTLKKIYTGLGIKKEFKTGSLNPAPPKREESEIYLSIKPFHKTAYVEIKEAGLDLDRRLKAKRMELADKDFNAIYVDLDLSNPHTPWAAEKLEEIGFFFSGLFPEFYASDALRLQYYMTDVIYDEIETASEFALELKNYVQRLDPKWVALNA